MTKCSDCKKLKKEKEKALNLLEIREDQLNHKKEEIKVKVTSTSNKRIRKKKTY